MWIDKKSLEWNPWDTDPWGKKRPSHLAGIRKMNEYHLQKIRERNERQSQQSGKQGNMQFVKVQYRDPDMQQLATQNKGTTSSYDYS
jgi:hypothetical protein